MKKFGALFSALLIAASAFGDVYSIAKQQAKNAANSESAQQGGHNPPPAPPPQNNPTPDPALQATLRNIAALRADFESLAANPTNTSSLKNDLAAAAQGAKPPAEAVAKLAQDLAAAIAANDKLHSQQLKLAQYVHALFNSSHLSAVQRQSVCDGIQKILQDGGVPAEAGAKVIDDLKAIATATK